MRVSQTSLWTQGRWQMPARSCSPAGDGLRAVLSRRPGLRRAVCPASFAGLGVCWGAQRAAHAEQTPAQALPALPPGGARFRPAAWSGQRGDAGTSPLTWLGTADTGRPAESCLQRDACSERVAHGSLRARRPERAGHRRPSGSSPRRGAFGGPSGPPAGRRCLLRNVRREALA